ncbi:MAG: hypothetical protein Ta2A_26820 [Treponemataceae bacterium]|nr:MAG: hypothetical protein Ta2A_26820 [Treponemataceae bacterium]
MADLTALAKTLADFLFDDEKSLTRIDMSEYMEKYSVSRLIGAPPGYVGYDEGGQLTEAVRRRPYGVVLFDEIEKAHSDVFNVLLQVLDDGRLTDGQGRTVDFTNTIIIMTSNLAHDGEQLAAALRQYFRPEFINRIDEIVMFLPLDKSSIMSIVKKQIMRLQRRLAENHIENHIELELTEKAYAFLAEKGFDPSFGARPVKRAIQTYIENPLSKSLLSGELASESHKIRVDADDTKLTFSAS